ncbi:hypothetical protein ES332_A07G204900v1 [Gossypium tomentosum]|uniref:Uncharacterized protein n=1 Tax=Gossypium tomentosum TaxID=34277 RepID=A0A5D2PVB0_GOSTO|nr:hypothetical protein ES332_A07G204900v1 [Gossypium tomentosum]
MMANSGDKVDERERHGEEGRAERNEEKERGKSKGRRMRERGEGGMGGLGRWGTMGEGGGKKRARESESEKRGYWLDRGRGRRRGGRGGDRVEVRQRWSKSEVNVGKAVVWKRREGRKRQNKMKR